MFIMRNSANIGDGAILEAIMKTYRVAILGCRSRGTAAAKGYHAHPRTEVVGLCDLIKERADTLGDLLNVSARFTDLDKMITQTEPDIVVIPTGTEFHYDLSMRVLEYGVNIDVEKPMCVDLEQADDVGRKGQEEGRYPEGDDEEDEPFGLPQGGVDDVVPMRFRAGGQSREALEKDGGQEAEHQVPGKGDGQCHGPGLESVSEVAGLENAHGSPVMIWRSAQWPLVARVHRPELCGPAPLPSPGSRPHFE